MAAISPVNALIGAGVSGDLFPDASKPLKNFQPSGFTTPGLTATVGPTGALDLTRTPQLSGAITDVSRQFGLGASQLSGLREQVTPGFGRLTQAAKQNIESERRRTIGNLRENLARRRVLGSSFAQDALSRAEAEFAQKGAQMEAQNILAEIDMSTKLLQAETQNRVQQFSTILNQMNFESGLAAQLQSGINQAMQRNAEAQSQIAAQSAAGIGGLIGTVAGGALGFMAGGPAGAMAGAQIGGSIGSQGGGALA